MKTGQLQLYLFELGFHLQQFRRVFPGGQYAFPPERFQPLADPLPVDDVLFQRIDDRFFDSFLLKQLAPGLLFRCLFSFCTGIVQPLTVGVAGIVAVMNFTPQQTG
ncbi:MAG: hypothetical protein P3T54_00015 [Dehalogenimonas sp.]|nr:hypothetical protein [Dehalogenimonas sp.]